MSKYKISIVVSFDIRSESTPSVIYSEIISKIQHVLPMARITRPDLSDAEEYGWIAVESAVDYKFTLAHLQWGDWKSTGAYNIKFSERGQEPMVTIADGVYTRSGHVAEAYIEKHPIFKKRKVIVVLNPAADDRQEIVLSDIRRVEHEDCGFVFHCGDLSGRISSVVKIKPRRNDIVAVQSGGKWKNEKNHFYFNLNTDYGYNTYS